MYGSYDTVPRNKLRYDTLYMRRMSPWLDVKLLTLSVWVTLTATWQERER